LRWNGHTVADIGRLRIQALELEQQGDFDGAGEKFREALDASRNLLPPADEHAVATAYQVAIFYAQQDEMKSADEVIDGLTDQFIDQWGKEHEETLKHYATVARLLEAWGRHGDSLNIIRRLTDNFSTSFVTRSHNGTDGQRVANLDLRASTKLSGTVRLFTIFDIQIDDYRYYS
jgi:tetratricopeptide (TPR) repeat protein